MATTALIITVGAFLMGAALLGVAIVSAGIRHEERLFREHRQWLQEQGDWLGSDRTMRYFAAEPPGWASRAARAATGLWIRRRKEAEQEASPWYERQI